MVYYFHAAAEILRQTGRREGLPELVICTPSGNFGNLTAGLMAKRAGLAVTKFVAATNVNDVVPEYLETGRFVPRPSVATIANAMDVGDPSNFERMRWLYADDPEAMRRDIAGSRHTDDDVRAAIRQVFHERGYLLDPHSAIAYLGLKHFLSEEKRPTSSERVGVFLATAHPAKFREIVEPIIGRPVETPGPLADALARPRHILRIDASIDALTAALDV
jgi:threonine synthase